MVGHSDYGEQLHLMNVNMQNSLCAEQRVGKCRKSTKRLKRPQESSQSLRCSWSPKCLLYLICSLKFECTMSEKKNRLKLIFIFTKKQRSTTTLAFVSPCSALKMKCMFSRNYCRQPKHLIKNRKGLQVQPKT